MRRSGHCLGTRVNRLSRPADKTKTCYRPDISAAVPGVVLSKFCDMRADLTLRLRRAFVPSVGNIDPATSICLLIGRPAVPNSGRW